MGKVLTPCCRSCWNSCSCGLCAAAANSSLIAVKSVIRLTVSLLYYLGRSCAGAHPLDAVLIGRTALAMRSTKPDAVAKFEFAEPASGGLTVLLP